MGRAMGCKIKTLRTAPSAHVLAQHPPALCTPRLRRPLSPFRPSPPLGRLRGTSGPWEAAGTPTGAARTSKAAAGSGWGVGGARGKASRQASL